MTTFVAAKCPNCGGELQVPQDRNSVRCMYCSGDVVVRQAVLAASGGNPDNWMKLGSAAAEAGNHQEAIANFNKVLEVDPNNWEAWLEKANSTGWLSNLSDCRIGEMVAHTRQALACTPKEKLQELKPLAAVAINEVARAYNDMACKHLRQFITVDVAWPEFIEQTMAAFEGLEYAHELDPKNKVVLRNMVTILTDLIQGVAYQDSDAYGRPTRRVHRIKSDYALRMNLVKQDCETKLKQLDPSYQAKEVKKAKAGVGWTILSILRLFGATRF
jgi:tetratricopeptide (TPR) repeat protein